MNIQEIGLFLLNGDQYSGRGNEGYWNTVAIDLASAFTALGQTTIPLNFWQNEQDMRLLMYAHQHPPKFCFTLNMIPNGIQVVQPDPHPNIMMQPFAQMTTTHITGLFDHPMHLIAKIKENTAACANLKIGILDPKHRPFLERIGVQPDNIYDFLFAGPNTVEGLLPISERPYDILFTGGIQALEDESDFIARFTSDPHVTKAYQKAIERILSEDDDVFEIVFEELQNAGKDLSVEEACEHSIVIDRYTRIITRHRIFTSLKDHQILVAGPIADNLVGPNMTVRENVSFQETLDLMGQSKLVISDTINMRDGLVLRPFYAMSRGVVILAQPNGFWQDHFTLDHDYVGLDLTDIDLSEKLTSLLNDPARLEKIASNMAHTYEGAHTWEKRIENSPVLRSLIT